MQDRKHAASQAALDNRLTLVFKVDGTVPLQRVLGFYCDHPFKLLIIDTSTGGSPELGSEVHQLEYHHLPGCTDEDILVHMVRQVSTPYLVMVGEQSFCLPDALVQCLDFLDGNPDYAVCRGYSLMNKASGTGVKYYIGERKRPDRLPTSDARQRLLGYMTHYFSLSNAVMRTALIDDWCSVATTFEASYRPVCQALFLLLAAEARILPIAYGVDALGSPAPILPERLSGNGPVVLDERERLGEHFASVPQVRRNASGVSAKLVCEALEALDHCLRSSACPTPEQVLDVRYAWQKGAQYTFLPDQYVELPFYNEAFFEALEQIGFLLLALPYSGVQIEALEPLVIKQQELLRERAAEHALERDQRAEAALELYPFDVCLAERVLCIIRQRNDQVLTRSLEAWLVRLRQVRPTGTAHIMQCTQSGLIYQRLHAWRPSTEQQRAIIQQGNLLLGLVLLDLHGNVDALQTTLDSLLESFYKRYQIVVLTTTRPPVSTCAQDRLHFVQVEKTAWHVQLNRIVEHAAWDWLLCVNVGVAFSPSGLMKVAKELTNADQCKAVYCDEVQRLADGTLRSLYRPSFNLDLLLSSPRTMARHWFVRRELFMAMGGHGGRFPDAWEFDFILRLIEWDGMSGIGHIDDLLLVSDIPAVQDNADEVATLHRHLRVRGYERGRIQQPWPGSYHVSYGHAACPLVSIIIPTRDQLTLVSRCVETVLEHTRYKHFEIILVDNLSETAEAISWLKGIEAMGDPRLQVLRYPYPFNFSAMNNRAAAQARGEYLVLLNNDTAVINDNWLDELLNHALRPEVGIVGARLHFPNGTLQHAGVVLGLRGPAEHHWLGRDPELPGYMGRARVDQNFSAVTAACLMVRKYVYEQVGGLDEQAFGVSYNDVDLCLKVGREGYLNVWAQRAVLMHEGSVSQITVDPLSQDARRARFIKEQNAFYERWMPLIVNDPAYNRNLSLCGNGFEVDGKPLLETHLRELPMVLIMADSRSGAESDCGWDDLASSATVTVTTQRVLIADLLRMAPEVLIMPGNLCHMDMLSMLHFRRYYEGLKILDLRKLDISAWTCGGGEIDAVLSALPLVDRLLTSDEYLTRTLRGLHSDVRLISSIPVMEPAKGLPQGAPLPVESALAIACLPGEAAQGS